MCNQKDQRRWFLLKHMSHDGFYSNNSGNTYLVPCFKYRRTTTHVLGNKSCKLNNSIFVGQVTNVIVAKHVCPSVDQSSGFIVILHFVIFFPFFFLVLLYLCSFGALSSLSHFFPANLICNP